MSFNFSPLMERVEVQYSCRVAILDLFLWPCNMVGPSAWHLYPTRSKLISLLQNFLTWVSKMWQTCFMATYTAVVNPFVLY